MEIKPDFSSFKISAKGMGIQKQRMELITENIANTSTTKTEDGTPYQRKYISVKQENANFATSMNRNSLALKNSGLSVQNFTQNGQPKNGIENFDPELKLKISEETDKSEGEMVYMPDHPDANEDGYLMMPNVSVVTEMVDMISASRSFEANLTAFNAAKQIAKDSLDI
ncbi:MAG: flagellar basal body rod protein FlgC [Ignavibacteriales bacterium]|nr:flagellar basal body rod protein FlgC [Ignavibacteriota bacterium]MCB9248070.1 flagellar basal body rod protein FlgC [Ignavibacteriales bacterium]